MSTNNRSTQAAWFAAFAAAAALAALAIPVQAAQAPQRDFSAQKPADPSGTVEIVDVEGTVEVTGWDQPTVDVTGKLGPRVERVDVTSSANRTTIHVVVPNGGSYSHGENAADLKIHVPKNSSLDVSLVSADLRTNGVGGNQRLQTVSGDIQGDVGGGSLQVDTVSGDVHLDAHNGHNAQIKTVSGDVSLNGSGGDFTLNTVSGDTMAVLNDLDHVTYQSVSGDLNLSVATLSEKGQLDATNVSGDVKLHFAAAPDADINVQSLSGDISSCFGPKPVESQYGPGSHLNFRSGKGGARVQVTSQSGDVTICTGK
jgi:DUF4097 and DUF4098 domain-containing protein YvlB